MLEPLIQAIQEAVKVETIEFSGRKFTTQPIHLVQDPQPQPVIIQTLNSVCRYLDKTDLDAQLLLDIPAEILIQVKSDEVVVSSHLSAQGKRVVLLRACCPLFGFRYDEYMDRESFQIGLMQWFAESPQRNALLEFISSVSTSTVTNLIDNGVSQTIETKKGTSGASTVTIQPIIKLAPLDVFPEIEVIDRDLIFRLQTKGDIPRFALFSPSDGLYNLERTQRIIEFLDQNLGTRENITILG